MIKQRYNGLLLMLLCIVHGPGCVNVSSTRRAQKMPFTFPEGKKLFAGPFYLNSIGFYIEVPPEKTQAPIQAIPAGIRLAGEWVVLQSGIYKEFYVGRKSYFYKKGEMPFVFQSAEGESMAMKFRGLPVTLETTPGLRPVVVLERDDATETMAYEGGRIIFRRGLFLLRPSEREAERGLRPDEVKQGIIMPKKSGIRVVE